MTLTLKAQVRGGRLVLDEPTDLPEGSEVELVIADEGDDLDDADRTRLHASLQRSAEQFRAGLGIDAEEALARLRGVVDREPRRRPGSLRGGAGRGHP